MEGALREYWANPSSVHRAGQEARRHVELARKDVAALIGANPREVVFTSGGTEAIDLAIRGVLGRVGQPSRLPAGGTPAPPKPVVVSTRTEHVAVRELLEDLDRSGRAQVRWAPLSREGVVDLGAMARLVAGAALVSVQWANNETGTVQPAAEIGAACRAAGAVFHCDATQWVGKEMADAQGCGADILTFAPHKFHGPKGVGVLWAKRGVGLRPQIHGAQEMGRRGGTENVAGIVGAGIACREAREWLADGSARARLAGLRDRFERMVLEGVADAVVNGAGATDRSEQRSLVRSEATPVARIWNTTNIGFPRLEAEAILLLLSERGICASAGAACSSGSLEPSPVLLAMGVPPEIAHGSVRFSLSRETTEREVEEGAAGVVEAVRRLRA